MVSLWGCRGPPHLHHRLLHLGMWCAVVVGQNTSRPLLKTAWYLPWLGPRKTPGVSTCSPVSTPWMWPPRGSVFLPFQWPPLDVSHCALIVCSKFLMLFPFSPPVQREPGICFTTGHQRGSYLACYLQPAMQLFSSSSSCSYSWYK